MFQKLMNRTEEMIEDSNNHQNETFFYTKIKDYEKYYTAKHGELGYTLKVIWQTGMDLTWLIT